MCKSFETSITTYVVTLVSTIIVWNLSTLPTYRFFALFMLIVGHIQLVDAILWTSIRNKWHGVNIFVSRYLIIGVLMLELLGSYYGIRHYFGWSNRYYEAILWISVVYSIYSWFVHCKETIRYTDGYLMWCNDTHMVVTQFAFLFFLTFPIIMGYPNILLKWIVLGLIVSTFAINFLKSTYGTRWCWSGNIIAVILLAMVLYEKYVAKKKIKLN